MRARTKVQVEGMERKEAGGHRLKVKEDSDVTSGSKKIKKQFQ